MRRASAEAGAIARRRGSGTRGVVEHIRGICADGEAGAGGQAPGRGGDECARGDERVAGERVAAAQRHRAGPGPTSASPPLTPLRLTFPLPAMVRVLPVLMVPNTVRVVTPVLFVTVKLGGREGSGSG